MLNHPGIPLQRHQPFTRSFAFLDVIIETNADLLLLDKFLIDAVIAASNHEDIADRF